MNRFVALLFALVGLVLLIACFKATGMLLARGVTRAPELGIRLALGAARARVIRLLVVESLAVSLAGAIVGLVGAWGALGLVELATPLMPSLHVSVELGVGWRVILFSVVLATVTGLACGLAPAWVTTRLEVVSTLIRDRGGRPPRLRARSIFLVAQVELSVLLVVCALLLTRIPRVGEIDPGFRIAGVDVIGLNLRLGRHDTERGQRFVEALMSQIESLPGLEAAASALVVPLTREREGGRFVTE